MKTRYFLLTAAVVFLGATACTDKNWEDHYNNSETQITNEQLTVVTECSRDYLSAQSQYSKMFAFLTDNQVFTTLEEKGQLHTLLVVENDDFIQPEADEAQYIANSHVTDIAISPSNLYDGERILMWHGKFVTVGIDSLGLAGQLDHLTFNTAPVKRVVKTADGYIYVLSSMIVTPESLYDFINNLGDDYSVFRELVLASGGKEFDKTNSRPVGVDATGNTIYDTVWIYTNDFFDAKDFSLSSESLTATMLLFSNDVIEAAMDSAYWYLKSWGLDRDRDVLYNWILEVAFFKTKYTPEAYEAATDLKSIYDRQWRVACQEVDTDNPISVSNGIIYEVKHLHIPTNVLIYRLKDYYRNYEYCSDTEKTQYFVYDNFKNLEIKTEVAGWTPYTGVWPLVENVTLSAYCNDATASYYLKHQLIHAVKDESGNVIGVQPYVIPPGTYRFAMGFAQNQNVTYTVSVYVLDGTDMVKIGDGSVTIGSTTEFHYDRGTFLSDTWPEGYKEVKETEPIASNSKRNNYDTDGGCVIEELTVPDLKGDGTALPMVILLENATGTSTRLVFHHWCLRPTSNNY